MCVFLFALHHQCAQRQRKPKYSICRQSLCRMVSANACPFRPDNLEFSYVFDRCFHSNDYISSWANHCGLRLFLPHAQEKEILEQARVYSLYSAQ